MRPEAKALLWDIQQACARLERFLDGVGLDQYLEDELIRAGAERQFEIIGEALNQLLKQDASLASRFPHARQIIAFRNLLIHGCAAVDDRRVWHTADLYLPPLRIVVDSILNDLGPTQEPQP